MCVLISAPISPPSLVPRRGHQPPSVLSLPHMARMVPIMLGPSPHSAATAPSTFCCCQLLPTSRTVSWARCQGTVNLTLWAEVAVTALAPSFPPPGILIKRHKMPSPTSQPPNLSEQKRDSSFSEHLLYIPSLPSFVIYLSQRYYYPSIIIFYGGG